LVYGSSLRRDLSRVAACLADLHLLALPTHGCGTTRLALNTPSPLLVRRPFSSIFFLLALHPSFSSASGRPPTSTLITGLRPSSLPQGRAALTLARAGRRIFPAAAFGAWTTKAAGGSSVYCLITTSISTHSHTLPHLLRRFMHFLLITGLLPSTKPRRLIQWELLRLTLSSSFSFNHPPRPAPIFLPLFLLSQHLGLVLPICLSYLLLQVLKSPPPLQRRTDHTG
jgi:hypothetical protein